MAPEDEESFKVTDRRRRPSEPAADPPHAESAPEPRLGPAPGEDPAPGASRPPRESGGPDLQGLFAMFASSALIALGAAPHPATGQPTVDLEEARETIDILLLLREKTEGNRTEQESRLLEAILYELQMRFVQATRVTPRP